MPEPQPPGTSPRQKRSLILTLGWFATTLLAVTCLLSMFVGSTLTLRLRWGLMEWKLGEGGLSLDWDKSSQFVNHPREFEFKQYRKLGVFRSWGENFDWQYVHFADGLQGLKGSLRAACHLGAPTLALMFLCLYYRRQLQRLFPAGSCPGCGYNITGANHERCPECGQSVDPVAIRRFARRIWWARLKLAALLLLLPSGTFLLIYHYGSNDWEVTKVGSTPPISQPSYLGSPAIWLRDANLPFPADDSQREGLLDALAEQAAIAYLKSKAQTFDPDFSCHIKLAEATLIMLLDSNTDDFHAVTVAVNQDKIQSYRIHYSKLNALIASHELRQIEIGPFNPTQDNLSRISIISRALSGPDGMLGDFHKLIEILDTSKDTAENTEEFYFELRIWTELFDGPHIFIND